MAQKRFRDTLLLLASTLAALCLFLSPSTKVVLLLCAIFCAVLLSALVEKPSESRPFRPAAAGLAVVFCWAGFVLFFTTWRSSPLLAGVLSRFGLNQSLLVGVLGVLGSLVGFPAFYRLAWRMDLLLDAMLGIPVPGAGKGNAFLPLSAAALFFLEHDQNLLYFLGIPIAVVLCAMASTRLEPLLTLPKKYPKLSVFCGLTAAGICWAGYALNSGLPGLVAAVLSFPFTFFCLLLFFRALSGLLDLSDLPRWVRLGYAALFLARAVFSAAVFFASIAFHCSEAPYDVIYTSDSTILVKGNAYLLLLHFQNDLRQPLYAVFAAPFLGLSFLLSKLLGASAPLHALLMNLPQVALLVLCAHLLGRMLGLSPRWRLAFVALACCTWPLLLFSVMMEQYIMAVFYLLCFAFQFCCRDRRDRLTLMGAGGTLLTSLILLPVMSRRNPVKDFRDWYGDMLNRGLEFILALLAFCRLDIILGIATSLIVLGEFSGAGLNALDKLRQFSVFLGSCILAPESEAVLNSTGSLSWQLVSPAAFAPLGICVAVLCLLGFWFSRKDRAAQMAAFWLAFSFVVLVGMGWGTMENGLILYSLYFGWAVLLLLFRLAQALTAGLPRLRPVLYALCLSVLAWQNLPAMARLLSFAIQNYPA